MRRKERRHQSIGTLTDMTAHIVKGHLHAEVGESLFPRVCMEVHAIDKRAVDVAYPPADVWLMTPRQIAGCVYFAHRRKQKEVAEQLAIAPLGRAS
jgi:hypothetical protein